MDDATGQVLWQANTVNERGQLTSADYGNGITINNTYDQYGFPTQSRHFKAAAAVNVMTLNTTFEPLRGNLTSRYNSLFNKTETFQYDNLDRLTTFTNAKGQQEQQAYNNNGTIQSNSTGDYRYSNMQKPNQNTSVTLSEEAKAYYQQREGLFNASMEQQNGWTTYWNPTAITYDTLNAHSGNYSLKLTNPGTSEIMAFSEISIPINNTVDTAYTYSAWMLGTGGEAEMFLYMGSQNTVGSYDAVDNVITTVTGNWVKMEKTVVVPASVKYLSIRVDNNGGGTIWYDDVRIRKTSNGETSLRELNITYNAYKSPVEIIEPGCERISFEYNTNNARSTMYYGGLQEDKMLRPLRKHYSADGSMEIKYNTQTGATEFITYIGGDGYSAPVVLKSNGITEEYLYLHRDYQGSILAITNQAGNIVEKRLFDAWGAIVKVQDGAGNILSQLTVLDRGYTGHEHLQGVNLIHMNARLYDPVLHRFLQPDNYVQDPFNPQNYNRYGYVLNNPLKYTDITGEWFGVDDFIAGIIGGVVNLGVNIWQGNIKGNFWEVVGKGAAAFGSGFGAGVLSLYGPAGWAAGGALVGGTNAWLSGSDPVKRALMGGVTGLVGGQLGKWASQAIGTIIINGVKVTSPLLQGTIIGSLGSGTTGGLTSFSMSLLSGESLDTAISRGLEAAKMGLVTGAIAGAGSAYANSVKNGVNPINGKSIIKTSNVPNYDFTPDPNGDNITLYRGTTGSENNGGPLFMTDSYEYAATYVKNGGQVVKVTMPRSTYMQMSYYKHIQTLQGLHGTSGGLEYQIHPSVARQFINRFKN